MNAERARLRLDDHRPRVMSAFVRNRLLDEVYLPLIGDSLAKQLGTADADRRTDSQGLLLLVSPPGYGKTTLMEYVADRLGLVLVKISGPNLGYDVTSLDPSQARTATARQEIEKINFALESGNNTLLYLDDIQHTSPELLQKFIPLCDATRRIEGVRDGEPLSHDLRGKRFAVCMAGNPYTESGERFRIPDMLANRADVWNLGEVLSGREDVFALSFVENALTANPVLAPLMRPLPRGPCPVRAPGLQHFPGARRGPAGAPVHTRRGGPDRRGPAPSAEGPGHGARRERRVHRLGGADGRDAHRAAVPAPGFVPQHEQDRRADRAGDERRGAVRRRRRPLRGRGPDTDVRRGVEPAEARRAARPAHPEQSARWSAITAAYVRTQALGGPDGDPMTRAVAALGLLADRIAAVESAIVRVADPRHLLTNPQARHAAPPREATEEDH